LALEFESLGRGLDHQLARTEIAEVQRGFQALRRSGRVRFAPASTGRAALEVALDLIHASVKGIRHRVVQERSGAGQASELRDPSAHRAGADDADDGWRGCRRHAGTSALIPVSARPMISFWIWEVPSYRVVTRTSRK